MVSHELRTPLHTIVGYAQLLRRDGGRDLHAKLNVIERSGVQLRNQIDQILEYTRGDSGKESIRSDSVSLRELAGQLNDTGKLLAAAGANQFVVQVADDVPSVVAADEQKLVQVLTNLVGNACKYTSRGTVALSITTALPNTNHAAVRDQVLVQISVTDTGIGIAKEYQDKIFEPFGRTPDSERSPGLGLGLTIARQMIRAMGSEITLTSSPGAGSCFSFVLSLPVLTDEEDDEPSSAELRKIIGHTGPQKTLLIVDDVIENRMLLEDLCRDWGFCVLTANDGAQALEICQQVGEEIDAVLVDQFMPVMGGWEFLAQVRAQYRQKQFPIALISATGPEPPENTPMDLQFEHVFLKPVHHQELAEYLRECLSIEWRYAEDSDSTSEPLPTSAGARMIEKEASQLSLMRPNEASVATPADTTVADCTFASNATYATHATHAKPAAVTLTNPQWRQLSEMIALGRVVAIRRWANELVQGNPDQAELAGRILALAERIDLPGLKSLADAMQPNSPDDTIQAK